MQALRPHPALVNGKLHVSRFLCPLKVEKPCSEPLVPQRSSLASSSHLEMPCSLSFSTLGQKDSLENVAKRTSHPHPPLHPALEMNMLVFAGEVSEKFCRKKSVQFTLTQWFPNLTQIVYHFSPEVHVLKFARTRDGWLLLGEILLQWVQVYLWDLPRSLPLL